MGRAGDRNHHGVTRVHLARLLLGVQSGRDWSGIMVNVSTQHILAENNVFRQGHGVSIGSETSGWVRNVVIRNSYCNGTNTAVRIKSCRGRGGGVENIVYDNMTGSVGEAVQVSGSCITQPLPCRAPGTPGQQASHLSSSGGSQSAAVPS